MKRSVIQLIGASALVSMLGLPVALYAATRPASAASVDIGGIVRPVELIRQARSPMDKLGFVDSQGNILVLRRSRADRAAYREARRLSNGEEWVHLVGIKAVYDGVPAVRIQKVSVE